MLVLGRKQNEKVTLSVDLEGLKSKYTQEQIDEITAHIGTLEITVVNSTPTKIRLGFSNNEVIKIQR